MDVLIYGAGTCCQKLLITIEKYKNINVIGIADSYAEGSKYGYKILDLLGSEERIPEDVAIVIAISRPYTALQIGKKLNENGYKNIWVYLNKDKSHAGDFLKGECIRLNGIDELTFPYIEMQIVDYCNLNCRGCSHFSPLFERKASDFSARIQDLYFLRKLFHNIFFISLLGGEPLLSPDMGKYVVEARKLFPDSEIRIVTNGLLLCEGGIDDDLMRLIAENNITVLISEYKPTHRVIKKITDRLEMFKIDYMIMPYESKAKFHMPISVTNHSKYNLKCSEKGCVIVCEGKLAKCPPLLCIHKFNERFEQELPQEGILELKDYKNGKCLIDDIIKKVPLCDYCIDCEIDWGICKSDMTIVDFAVLD